MGLLDLTSLGESDTEKTVDGLCARADTPVGQVAAVCVWPRFVRRCVANLDGSDIAVAAVANFPAGGTNVKAAVAETGQILDSGGREVDLVMPYRAWLVGDRGIARDMIAACRATCGHSAHLKVILETGAMGGAGTIAEASRDAIEAGAHFIKTSTGKAKVNATPEAARVMLEVIRDCGATVGFKAAGGIRTQEQALEYVRIAEDVMGPNWVSPERFRIGASSLLDALLAQCSG